MPAKIIAIGDSITKGAFDVEGGGWVERLRKFFHQTAQKTGNHEFAHSFYNLGIAGDTSSSLLTRFKSEANLRTQKKSNLILLFAIGINDSQLQTSTQNLFTPLSDFKSNLQELINQAKTFTPQIAFVGLTPCDDSKLNPFPWRPEASIQLKFVRQFDQAIQSVCAENQIPFIDIMSDWEKQDWHKFLSDDGLHPNDLGHQKISDQVKNHLLKNFLPKPK